MEFFTYQAEAYPQVLVLAKRQMVFMNSAFLYNFLCDIKLFIINQPSVQWDAERTWQHSGENRSWHSQVYLSFVEVTLSTASVIFIQKCPNHLNWPEPFF